jgi:hypothetical protein
VNASTRDYWVDRSGQRWKVRAAHYVLLMGTGAGLYLFFRGQWPESFYGGIICILATPLAAATAATVRCRVCGRRVALDAPLGHWLSYTAAQKTCPECGDDGEARPAAPGELSVWQQAVREVAAREREAQRARRRFTVRVALVVALVALAAWFVVRVRGA